MPVSRRRTPRSRSQAERRRRAQRHRATTRFAATATAEDLSSLLAPGERSRLRASADAELRGDAAEALRLYGAIDRFDDSPHLHRLRLLAELGEEAPAWLVSRWLTLQARRPLWTGAPADTDPPVLNRALAMAYPHGVATDRMLGMSMPVFAACLHEYDWVLRQLVVYDDGGLSDLVQRFAWPALLDRADSPVAWADARMGGYRFESDVDGSVQVTDLATDERIDLLDLGVGFEHWPGQHLLARVVPTTSGPGRMFEWRPLPVDETTAHAVAEAPGSWTDIVAAHARSLRLPHDFSLMEHGTDVLTDLCDHPWVAGLHREDIGSLPSVDGVIDHDDVALFMLERFVRGAHVQGTVPPALRPVLFSLVLQPGLAEDIGLRICPPEYLEGWRTLAACLPEPARSRCAGYARLCLEVG